MSVWAVVPAYNEQERIQTTLSALLDGVGCRRVIVVDDGSLDATSEVASRSGASVVRLSQNSGKGRALCRGIEEVEREGRDVEVVLLADADLGESAARLTPLIEAVHDEGRDLAIASFLSRGGFGLAKGVAARGIELLTGRAFQSPLSGQRALSRRALALLSSMPPGWGIEVAMTVKALQSGLDVVEVPVALSHRETQKDLAGFLHRGRQCWAILATLGGLAWDGLRRPKGGWAH